MILNTLYFFATNILIFVKKIKKSPFISPSNHFCASFFLYSVGV